MSQPAPRNPPPSPQNPPRSRPNSANTSSRLRRSHHTPFNSQPNTPPPGRPREWTPEVTASQDAAYEKLLDAVTTRREYRDDHYWLSRESTDPWVREQARLAVQDVEKQLWEDEEVLEVLRVQAERRRAHRPSVFIWSAQHGWRNEEQQLRQDSGELEA